MPLLDVDQLKQMSMETLRTLLTSIHGDKDLVLDPELMRPLDRVAGMTLLKACGVSKVFKRDIKQPPPPMDNPVRTIVFLTKSALSTIREIVALVKSCKQSGSLRSSVYLVCLPKAYQSIHVLLEEDGLAGEVHLRTYMWQLIPLEADLLTLEMKDFFKTCYLRNDSAILGAVSNCLHGLSLVLGRIPNRIAIGPRASAVLQQWKFLESKSPGGDPGFGVNFGHVFLFDRNIDYVSCLLSPVTYEALLDEVFGIECGVVDFSQSELTESDEKLHATKLQLSSKDKVFNDIRHLHFGSIFSYLSSNAKQIRQSQGMANQMNVNEMKQFIKDNLKTLQSHSKSVSTHISASELIMKEKGSNYEMLLPFEDETLAKRFKDASAFLEDALARLLPIEVTLRALALLSVVQDGLTAEEHAKMKKRVCEAYGYKHLITLSTMEEAGLFRKKNAPSAPGNTQVSFSILAQKLGLLQRAGSSSSELERKASFVFNNIYTPVICQIVSDVLTQQNSPSTASVYAGLLVQEMNQKAASPQAKTDLIFFLGGYTMAEVAALRTVQARIGRNFVIAGTSNITGKDIIESCYI